MQKQSIYQTHKPSGGNDDKLKLADGDKVKLRIASEPVGTIYKRGDKLRYAWTVYNRDAKKAQWFPVGVSIYRQVADLVEDWGLPTEFDITVKRTGSTINDTEYSVVPVKQSEDLTPEQQQECDAIDIIKITKGRWLADIDADGIMPTPIVDDEPLPDFADIPDDAPINLDDIPFK